MSNESAAEAWLGLQDKMMPIIDATAGHRAQLEAQGFSPTVAEMMAVDFHRHLLMVAFQRKVP